MDVVLDAAHQLGTGMWTTQDALSLHVPTPTIDIAVAMRNLSGMETMRHAINQNFGDNTTRGLCRSKAPDRTCQEQPVRRFHPDLCAGLCPAGGSLKSLPIQPGYSRQSRASGEVGASSGRNSSRASRRYTGKNAGAIEPDPETRARQAGLGTPGTLARMVQTATALGIPAPASMASLAYIDSLPPATYLPT